MKKIEILGPGCARCQKTASIVREAVDSLGWKEGSDYTLSKVTSPNEIAAKGVLMTPGVIIDGNVVSSGKIPAVSIVLSWFK